MGDHEKGAREIIPARNESRTAGGWGGPSKANAIGDGKKRLFVYRYAEEGSPQKESAP